MKLKKIGDERIVDVELSLAALDECEIRIDGQVLRAGLRRLPDGSALLVLNGHRIRVAGAREKDKLLAAAGPLSCEFINAESERGGSRHGISSPELISPMPGKILNVLVREGDSVQAGDSLLVLEAMKMETTLYAEGPATITRIHAVAGAMVEGGAVLIEFTLPSPSANESAPPVR